MSVATERGLTLALARGSSALAFEDMPHDVVEIARQALLDWFGVTIGGCGEEAPSMLLDTLPPGDSREQRNVTVVGRAVRLPALHAALVNGTASHALDFDDVNLTLPGHASVAVIAAALALAEQRRSSGRELITAFVAGYETACRVALAIGARPYLRGFHATGTVGTFAAAAACARLLGLDSERTAMAFGLAASQAAGLKCNFGTMAKPLHAGKACENGLLSALLADRGFTANSAAIEAAQGFAALAGGSCDMAAALAEPPDGWHLRENVFKYHAACFFTHSTIEGIRELRSGRLTTAAQVQRVTLHVSEVELGACAIAAPVSELEVKFSIAHLAAMALLDRDTTVITDADAADDEVLALRAKVGLVADGPAGEPTRVEVVLRDGSILCAAVAVGRPQRDLAAQQERLSRKFLRLAEPVLGPVRAAALREQLPGVDAAPDLRHLMALAAM
jgi:2-methylcitrate dehydratase PrpD